jgi:tRNA-2-methylthio-N6-dimethylallyladenosine synthase
MTPTTTTAKKKAYVETYGCQMNVSDGELMQGILASGGYDIVASPEDADVVLVNTCAIREHAEQRVIGRVGELYRLKGERPDMVIGVTGCMAQRIGPQLLEQAQYVDLVMGPDEYRRLPETLGRLRADHPHGVEATTSPSIAPAAFVQIGARRRPASTPQDTPRIASLELDANENYEGLEVRRTSKVNAWIPVQRGCNYRCTYCIVPYVRGDEKNREHAHILAEVRELAGQGITDFTLLGQTVNSWEHGERRFHHLLRDVARVDGVRRVRFTSPHPNDFTPELVEVMAAEPAVCNWLHLPVQSGHDRTLKRMLRRYTVAEYLDRIRMVRDAIPDIALSTDIIVAFPGETEAEYEATLDLVREVRFDDAFLYRYSPRDGTPATRLPAEQFIPDDVGQRRLQRVIDLHREIQAEINTAEVGRTVEVLVERAAKSSGDMMGRTSTYKTVAFPGDETMIGRYVLVRIVSTTGSTFRGMPV